jgi:hypothetical protein
MLNIYRPNTRYENESDLIESWGRDYGLTLLEVMNLTAEERRDALSALKYLAAWWITPIEREPGNPFWMEDEGYRDAERDTAALAEIAKRVFERRPEK